MAGARGPWPHFVYFFAQFWAAVWHMTLLVPEVILRFLGFKILNPKLPNTDMSGRICIVTGADTGIGKRTVVRLAERNAHIIMTARNKEKGLQAFDDVRREVPRHGERLELMYLDLNDFRTVEQFAQAFRNKYNRVDVLVNNAGIMLTGRTIDGFQEVFQSSFLGHFLLTKLLLDLIEATDGARVINLSSLMHRFGSTDWEGAALGSGKGYLDLASMGINPAGYADAKMAQLLFAEELRRRFHERHVNAMAIAVHPGTVKTEVWRSAPFIVRPFLEVVKQLLFISDDWGCFPSVYAATAPMQDLIQLNKEHDSLAPDEPPLYLEPYWLPFKITMPFEFSGPWIGVAASDPSLPSEPRRKARELWETSDRLLEIARTRKGGGSGQPQPAGPEGSGSAAATT